MPWIAPGVHVLFADKHEEWKFLQRVLAGERLDWSESEPAAERILFHQETVVGDLSAVRPGLLEFEQARKKRSP